MKVSDYIIEYLASIGIQDVFYVPGGGAMHLNDSLGANPKIEAVSMIFEQGAAVAAEAYARGKDGYAACLVTSGPGATNALTGLVGAYLDSVPVFFISGQVKRDDLVENQGIRQFGIQEVNIMSMVQSYTKYAVQIQKPEDIVYEMEKAAAMAVYGRPGPVWIDVPLDIQASMIDINKCAKFQDNQIPMQYAKGESICGTGLEEEYIAKEEDISEVISLINKSKRPILYIGHGIRLDHCIEEARRLYTALGIPVVTSWNGVDLIESDHPLYAGRPGGVGHRAANMIVHKADLVISIGTRFNLLATGYNFASFLENAIHVMVDIDENEMNKKSLHPEKKVVASAKSFICKMLTHMDKVTLTENSKQKWIDECKKLQEEYPIRIKEQEAREGFVSNYNLIEEISKQMNSYDMYQFTSSGTTVDIAMKVFKVKWGQRTFLNKGLAAMGYDVPASIGSAFANKRIYEASKDKKINKLCNRAVSDRAKVVCVTGDGSIAMNMQELEVIARYQLPVKIFVSDNAGYSMIYGSQNGNFHRLTGCNKESGLTLPNMENIAKAFGIKAMSILNEENLKEKIAEVLRSDEPVVCRVNTDIQQKILPRQCNYMREDGQMASRPLYDMTPLIEGLEI